MSSVNKAVIIGALGADPEVRYMTNGDAVCNLRVATSEKWKDKSSGEQKEATEWHRIVFYGKLAEIAGKYLTKGAKVYVEGKITTRKWTDKEGKDNYTTEIVGKEMVMIGGKPDGDSKPKPAGKQKPPVDDDEDGVPF